MTPGKRQKKDIRADAIEEYKELTKRLRSLNRNDDAAQVQHLIKENLERCAELYPLVKRKLDGTAADSKNIRELMKICQETSRRINSRPFETKSLIRNLIRDCQDTKEFYNTVFNEYVSSCIKQAPTFEFFYGALRNEGLVIKERRRKIKENIVETKAATATEREKDDVEQDSTPKEVEQIYQQITNHNPNGQLLFIPTLLDKNSFTKTVENIFHASFLIKESKIGLKHTLIDGRKEVAIHMNDDSSQDNAGVLSFTMQDYRNWILKYAN